MAVMYYLPQLIATIRNTPPPRDEANKVRLVELLQDLEVELLPLERRIQQTFRDLELESVEYAATRNPAGFHMIQELLGQLVDLFDEVRPPGGKRQPVG